MKAAFAVLALLICANGALASRSLQQLPTLGSSGSKPSAPAPSPSSSECVVGVLESSADFTTLLELVKAASEAELLVSLLSSDDELATVFAPTNEGIQSALTKAGLTAEDVLSDPERLTSILQYHITPSQLSPNDLKNGFSFNTLYEVNNVAQSVAIQGDGLTATVVGSASSAPIAGQLTVCQFEVYPINGLLLSNNGTGAIAAAPNTVTG